MLNRNRRLTSPNINVVLNIVPAAIANGTCKNTIAGTEFWTIWSAPKNRPKFLKVTSANIVKATNISLELKKENIETIIDDTDENFSSKIKKMNLIGAPYQIIIGKQTDGDLLEFKEVGKESYKIKLKDIIKLIIEQKVKNWFLN